MEFGGSNNLFRLSKLLCLALLLFAVSTANASPTITRHGTDLSTSLSLASTRTTTSGAINTIAKPVRAELANFAKEFLQPPGSSAGSLNVRRNSARPLPAVPATFLMLLAGFLCVTLYRDRKLWFTALAGLLWVSQVGIQTLPRLAQHFNHKNLTKHQICAELVYPHYLESFQRSRSDIEGTRYIGLLHHLGGIPDYKSTVNLHTFQPAAAIFKQDSLGLQFHCLASKAEQFICFSPAFIFENIPRGPPKLT